MPTLFILTVLIFGIILLGWLLWKKEQEIKALKSRQELQKSEEFKREQALLLHNRVSKMSETLSIIAHQWRQPLAAISSTAATIELKLLLEDYDKELFLKSIKEISAYAQHLSLTINDFRNFFKDSKIASLTTFESIIEEAVQMMHLSLESKSIALEIQNDYTKPLYAYEQEFKQVILSLLRNAEEAIAKAQPQSPTIRIHTYEHNGEACFEVCDNGGGVEKEIIERIFEPYFSMKTKKSGAGLGLYMAKTIIESHSFGSLEVHNENEGAVFTIKVDPKILGSSF
ncbi:MAG: HAMP domain-containing histidine kinase [Epsilonproteobacteria bacterium]|nr:HAMP domain-containing histidine kinase [Campylobacterota bacterium]